MLEIFIIGFGLVLCAACSYSGSKRSSGRIRITRPTEESAVGMGGVRARDFSYVDRMGRGFPVGLKQDRTEHSSFKEPRRKED